jgi:hypothetical protein
MSQGIDRIIEIEEENDLTGLVFGGLELLGSNALAEVLDSPQLESDLEFRYDVKLESDSVRRPDVIIEDNDTVIVVEAKDDAAISKSQLEEEFDDLQNYTSKDGLLYLVTAHPSEPEKLREISIREGNICWISWRDIAHELNKLTEEGDETQKAVVDLIIKNLREQGYVPFTGFESVLEDDRSLEEELAGAWDIRTEILRQINTFRRDLEGQLSQHGLKARGLYRDGRANSLRNFPEDWRFVMDHIWIIFGPSDFEIRHKNEKYLQVTFNIREAKIRPTYQLCPKSREEHRPLLRDRVNDICEFVDEFDAHIYRTSITQSFREELADEDEIRSKLTDEEWLKSAKRVHIGYEYEGEGLRSSSLTNQVCNNLADLHDFSENSFLENRDHVTE